MSPYVAMAAIRTVPCSSLDVVRLDQAGRALRDGVRVRGVDVRHLQRDVGDAVAVLGDVLGAVGVPARTAPVSTNRAEPLVSTYSAWSR